MANNTPKASKTPASAEEFLVSDEAQKNIIAFVKGVVQKKAIKTELMNKMEAIDIAYARYTKGSQQEQGLDATGRDNSGQECCGNVFDSDNIVAPIVVSQVDSLVAYLADVFLSGSPIFPVVSAPNERTYAEQLETLLDDHANLGGYVRQLLLFLKDGVKYNISAIEAPWESIEQFKVVADFDNVKTGRKLQPDEKCFTKLKRLDPYNILFDDSVNPGDVAFEGDWGGYIEIISKTKLKRLTTKLGKEKKGMNFDKALGSYARLPKIESSTAPMGNYKTHPTVSDYITARSQIGIVNWDAWMGMDRITNKNIINLYDGSSFEKVVVYARILPSDFGIKAPNPYVVQIWKFVIINMSVVIEATRIISAYDILPILFGQPMEDGLGLQTQSIAEGAIPFQEAATTLFNIKFAASRRAVNDRAVFNADLINPTDVNSKHPAAKIPVRFKALSNLGFDQAYKSIPFDMRGMENVINDARVIVGFSQELTGLNGPSQGQFQKGNKSVQEFNDTMAGSDNRLRLPAMVLECQVFAPLKQILALNIFQYGTNVELVSQKTGQVMKIDIDKLREQVMSFRIADGYSPKSKLASTEVLMGGFNLIMNSPILQANFGKMLPSMFLHMMSLGGVRGMDEYNPQQAVLPPPTPATENLADAALQGGEAAPVDTTTAAPVASDPTGGVPV
jgi:hypothetical protein